MAIFYAEPLWQWKLEFWHLKTNSFKSLDLHSLSEKVKSQIETTVLFEQLSLMPVSLDFFSKS